MTGTIASWRFSNGTFVVNESESLTASQLDTWLDEAQGFISGKVTVICDADFSGSFLPFLTPPEGKERIVLASTAADESAHFLDVQ